MLKQILVLYMEHEYMGHEPTAVMILGLACPGTNPQLMAAGGGLHFPPCPPQVCHRRTVQ